MSRQLIVGLLAILVALALLDPYSYGGTGGDIITAGQDLRWQIVLALADLGMLVLFSIAWFHGRALVARRMLIADIALLVAGNVFYVARDGQSRFFAGYEGSPLPMLAVATGLAIRLFLLVKVARLHSTTDLK